MKHKHIYILLITLAAIFSCIKFKELATLTTNNTSNLTINSVTSGGNITNGGSADITARGVCWSTSQSPTTAGSHTTDGTGTGSFTSSITGLDPDTKYYIRAYATNIAGTAYGNEVSFKTIALTAPTLTTFTATEIGSTTAKSGGTISSDGGAPITARGVCWSTSVNPTTDGLKSSDGSGSSDFVSNITGLSPATIYYYRAYATNSAGTAYGNELDFTTTCAPATATTNSATNVSASTANLNGTINANGSSTTVTFEYGKTTSYGNTVTASQSPVTGSSNMAVTGALSGLDINTTYHFRVKAVNCGGTTNGTDQVFTTICIAATAITNSATNLTNTTATLNGTVNANSSSTTITFEYGTTLGYGYSIAATPGSATGSSNTAVSAGLTGLSANTIYHYRVKAVNCGGTTYGSDLTFIYICTAPSATTNTVTNVGTTTATLNGIVNANSSSTTVTFEYGTTTSYGGTVTATQSPLTGSSNTPVSGGLSGLTVNTTYHYRVKASNCGGTTYGTDQTFTTTCIIATATTNTATNIGTTAATLNGSVNANNSSTTVTFEYGTTIGYGSTITATQSPVAGNNNIAVSGELSGLTINTLYHFRVTTVNCAGALSANDQTFNTLGVTPPTVTSTAITSLLSTSAISGGIVTSAGTGTINARGVCWSTTPTPTTSNSITSDGTGTGSYTSIVSILTPSTTYYLRAYAVNSAGATGYGNELTFTTYAATDVEGNNYTSVPIGSQTWLVQNLLTTRYRNGDIIGTTSPANSDISSESTPQYQWAYDGNESNVAVYGRLYTWYAITDPRGVCPTGWHVPTYDETITLADAIGGRDVAGGKLKETGIVNWLSPNTGATDDYGFKGLPGGGRGVNGSFDYIKVYGNWWTSSSSNSSTANYRGMSYDGIGLGYSTWDKRAGYSVRCLKD